ncbi:hypothetical protein [Pelobium manganitolerans]|uniref:hypothetical protein n=1 Tax=Pelobium manganitolerans TaxID=1842495 RepID=UPI003FA36E9B
MKINSKTHAILDYLLVLFVWLAPSLLGLPHVAASLSYGLGAIHLALTVCTHYEYGLIRFIHLKVHGGVELALAIILIPIAFYLNTIEGEFARNYFFGLTIVILLMWLLSDYTNKPESTREIPYVESSTDGGMI